MRMVEVRILPPQPSFASASRASRSGSRLRPSRASRRPSKSHWYSPSFAGCRRPGPSESRRRSREPAERPCPGKARSMSRSITPLPRCMAPGRWPRAHSLSSRTSTRTNFLAGVEAPLDLAEIGFLDARFGVLHDFQKAGGVFHGCDLLVDRASSDVAQSQRRAQAAQPAQRASACRASSGRPSCPRPGERRSV